MSDYLGGMVPAELSQAHGLHHGLGEKTHHLLRHSLSPEERGEGVLMHFETDSVAEAFKIIKRMSQRDLQAKFKAQRVYVRPGCSSGGCKGQHCMACLQIYGAKTHSNNNNWLRRKLFEAIGMDPAKGAGKKPAGAVQKRRKVPANKGVRAAKVAALQEVDHYAAEALLALGDMSGMLTSEESAPTASTGTGTSSDVAAAPTLTREEGKEWCESLRADREVPGNACGEPSAFAAKAAAEPQLSAQSPRQEEEGETEPAPASLFLGAPGSRANSSTLHLPTFDNAELSHMATNVAQLYTWLLARQQQQQQLASAPVSTAGYPALLTPHFMPMGLPGGYSHPFVHALPGPLPASYPMMGDMPPGALPAAPPLFNVAKTN